MRKSITQDEKDLIKADRLGASRIVKRSKIVLSKEEREARLSNIFGGTVAKKYQSLAPIGIATDRDTKLYTGNGQNLRNSDVDDEKERVKLGLTNRKSNVVYVVRQSSDNNKIKTCLCCNHTFGINNFSKNRKSIDGFQSSCKDCDKNRKLGNHAGNFKMRVEDEINKVDRVCKTCHTKKSILLFAKAGTSFRGSISVCKSCMKKVKQQKRNGLKQSLNHTTKGSK